MVIEYWQLVVLAANTEYIDAMRIYVSVIDSCLYLSHIYAHVAPTIQVFIPPWGSSVAISYHLSSRSEGGNITGMYFSIFSLSVAPFLRSDRNQVSNVSSCCQTFSFHFLASEPVFLKPSQISRIIKKKKGQVDREIRRERGTIGFYHPTFHALNHSL